MKPPVKFILSSFTVLLFPCDVIFAMEKLDDLTCDQEHKISQAHSQIEEHLMKLYRETNLDITSSQFEQLSGEDKVLYLELLRRDFNKNGLSQKRVADYVVFLRILFPHLKTSTKVWEDLEKRYGENSKNRAVVSELRFKINTAKKSFEEIQKTVQFANRLEQEAVESTDLLIKVDKYRSTLAIWEQVYEDTKLSNEYSWSGLNTMALGKRLELKRLERVTARKLKKQEH